MMMRVLLCTDGSPEAAQAVRFGASFACSVADAIELLGVVEDHADAESLIATALAGLGEELSSIGLSCPTRVRRGHAAEQILDEAETWQADLVIIGQLGRRGLTRFIMGSTATRIVQYAKCSVLLVRGQRTRLQKVLVCTAGGEPGLRDVALAGQLASLAQAQVTVLHVMSQVALTERGYQPELEARASDLIARRTPEGLHLQAALKTLQTLNVECRAKVRHGLVVDEIMAEAKEGDYDLLAIGAHLAQGLSRWLLDNITQHLLEGIQRPVLVVRD